jgi:hypothetical protein
MKTKDYILYIIFIAAVFCALYFGYEPPTVNVEPSEAAVSMTIPEPTVIFNVTEEEYISRYEDNPQLVLDIIERAAIQVEGKYAWKVDCSSAVYCGMGKWDCCVTFTNGSNWYIIFDEELGLL